MSFLRKFAGGTIKTAGRKRIGRRGRCHTDDHQATHPIRNLRASSRAIPKEGGMRKKTNTHTHTHTPMRIARNSAASSVLEPYALSSACLVLCWSVVFSCCHVHVVFIFCVPCDLMSTVLTPPILLPDYWLICPTCVYLISLLICSPIISLCL